MSTPWKRDGTPGRLVTGRRLAYRSSALRRPDVHAGEALAHRRRDRPLQGHAIGGHRVEQALRQRAARLLERRDAGVVFLPLDGDACRRDDAHDGGADLRPDAVPRNERDAMSHVRRHYRTVPTVDWQPWHTAAFLEAQRRRRPVLLLLETAWSPACADAHEDVFARPDVVAAIADTAVAIRVDADRRPGHRRTGTGSATGRRSCS